jgi:putative flavoprotein involved in K+ transport
MPEAHEIVVIGAGQAGLSISHELSAAGVEHVVLDRGRVAQTWRGRWDSFCLVIPNWTVQLAGAPYGGDDPDGFMPRDSIVNHMVDYAQGFGAPVREGVNVRSLEVDDGRFRLQSDGDDIVARQVVLATGTYQRPHRPSAAAALPESVHAIDADDYANPQSLPPGRVLVVGSGQTGCQIAEELHQSGRDVFLACGRAPWIPRRLDGRDTLRWMVESAFMDKTLADLPGPAVRLGANPQCSGRDGGHDLNYRTLQALGVTLVGRLAGIADSRIHFADDLAESVVFGDSRYADVCNQITAACAAQGVPAPSFPPAPPFAAEFVPSIDINSLGAVIFTSGFRPDYTSWVRIPHAFDDMGFPIQVDGSSTVVPGLYFMGVHFQRKRKSATLLGVGEDATVLAEHLVAARR